MIGAMGRAALRAAAAVALLLVPAFGDTTGRADEVRLVAMPAMPRPPYLQPATDPAFGTPIIRITDPGRELLTGVSCTPDSCRHRYASSEAWNANQSLIVIQKGCPGLCFLDGQSFRPLFQRRAGGACEWHPTDPDLMICVGETGIYRWSVREDTRSTTYLPAGYRDLKFGPGKGNLSRDGSRLVVRALDPAGAPVAFAYDLESGTKYPDIRLVELSGTNSYCSISPSGSFVYCFQTEKQGEETVNESYVFDIEGKVVQHWAEDHRPGHGDMTIDADGSDVYVGISKSEPDKFQVIKRRLSDGVVTVLSPRGMAQHVSLRNVNLPGWAFVTFGGTAERASRRGVLPIYQEIVALRIDGSGEMRRIAQTRSVPDGYQSEAHASPSPDGSQVVWASNWGKPEDGVAAYVARMQWDVTDPTSRRAEFSGADAPVTRR